MVTISGSVGSKTDQSQQNGQPGEGHPVNFVNGWFPSGFQAAAALSAHSQMGMSNMAMAAAAAAMGNAPIDLQFGHQFPMGPTARIDIPAVREEYFRLWRESLLVQHRQHQHPPTALLPETYHFVSRLVFFLFRPN